MTEKQIKNIVAFCALMENGEGIIGKSPDYIEEKFNRYCLSNQDETEWGLDSIRRAKVVAWTLRWLKRQRGIAGGEGGETNV